MEQPSPPIPSKRDAGRAERRQAILDGAVRVFADKGFFHATVAEVARAAGVADGTIYLYFKSKDELLLQVFDQKMRHLVDAARQIVTAAPSASEALVRICELQAQQVELNPALAQVLVVELRQVATVAREVAKGQLAEYLGLIADVVRRGQESHEFRSDVHPAALKRALFGALDEVSFSWLTARNRFDLRGTVRDLARVFVDGLRTPSPPAAPP